MKRYDGTILLAEKQRRLIVKKHSLQNYTWHELKTIANDLSSYNKDSMYYEHMLSLMLQGSVKTIEIDDPEIGENKQVRIIGLCQDVKEDGAMAGLTFQTTHALETFCYMNFDSTNKGGWGDSRMRDWLNSSVLYRLPRELRENIVMVRKYYRDYYFTEKHNDMVDDVYYVKDYLSVPSVREIYGYSNDNFQWYEWEGTGEKHNEQYAYYSSKGVTAGSIKPELHGLASTYNKYDGNSWWLRSQHPYKTVTNFHCVLDSGFLSDCPANMICGVVPTFAF